jgi:hypothetical protein
MMASEPWIMSANVRPNIERVWRSWKRVGPSTSVEYAGLGRNDARRGEAAAGGRNDKGREEDSASEWGGRSGQHGEGSDPA